MTGKYGTKWQGWKMQDWKMQDLAGPGK